MKSNARREVAGHVFDRMGRIIDGLIDNGRLVLMIGLFMAIAIMVNQLEDLAATSDDATDTQNMMLDATPSPKPIDDQTVTRVRDRSDYRIRLHRQCAEDQFREQNLDRCEQLSSDVADAVRDSVHDEIRRGSESHEGDTSLAPAVVASRTQQS